MPSVNIPDALFSEIGKVVVGAVSPEDFVVAAVREKLSWEGRKREFFRLSDETRAAMQAKGLTEADILAGFEDFRHDPTDRAHFELPADNWDAFCAELDRPPTDIPVLRTLLAERDCRSKEG
jgi:hypothetical protein